MSLPPAVAVEVARHRYRVAQMFAIALTIVLGLAFSGLMLLLLLGVRHAQDGITDCTRPGGICYERQLQNIRVAELNGRNILRVCMQNKVACEQLPAPTR